jgi:hypothetical protein
MCKCLLLFADLMLCKLTKNDIMPFLYAQTLLPLRFLVVFFFLTLKVCKVCRRVGCCERGRGANLFLVIYYSGQMRFFVKNPYIATPFTPSPPPPSNRIPVATEAEMLCMMCMIFGLLQKDSFEISYMERVWGGGVDCRQACRQNLARDPRRFFSDGEKRMERPEDENRGQLGITSLPCWTGTWKKGEL